MKERPRQVDAGRGRMGKRLSENVAQPRFQSGQCKVRSCCAALPCVAATSVALAPAPLVSATSPGRTSLRDERAHDDIWPSRACTHGRERGVESVGLVQLQ